jgi:16S rRNA (guanine966-N2)-methyltransferase
VTFVESDRRAQALIVENLGACGIESGYTMVRSTVERAWLTLVADPAFAPFDLILLDPPYDHPAGETLAGADRLLAPVGWVVLEHARRTVPPDQAGRLERARDLRSGDSALAIYTCPH